jgi:hypothetical protein
VGSTSVNVVSPVTVSFTVDFWPGETSTRLT